MLTPAAIAQTPKTQINHPKAAAGARPLWHMESTMQEKKEPAITAEAVSILEPAPPRPAADIPALPASRKRETEAPAGTELALRDELLEHQLNTSVPSGYAQEIQSKFRRGAVDLYASLRPKDAIDSILARLTVGLTNLTMDCVDRAGISGTKPARDVNLRYAMKGATVVVELIKARESRRGQGGQNVTVGKVNVEAGGQAIVGNIETGERRKATKPQSVPAFPSTEDED
jgi:hypothetical protein